MRLPADDPGHLSRSGIEDILVLEGKIRVSSDPYYRA